MKIQDAFIAIALISLVLLGVTTFIGDLSIKHSQDVDWGN